MDWRQLVSAAPYLYSIRLANPESSGLHHVIEMAEGERVKRSLPESESGVQSIYQPSIEMASPERNLTVTVSWGFQELLLKTLVILPDSCSFRQYQSTTPTRSPASPGRKLQARLPGFCDTALHRSRCNFPFVLFWFELCDIKW
jgi:hypothetical protein